MQDGKLLIFTPPPRSVALVGQADAIARRSLGDPFLFHKSPLSTIPINPTIAFTHSHINALIIFAIQEKKRIFAA